MCDSGSLFIISGQPAFCEVFVPISEWAAPLYYFAVGLVISDCTWLRGIYHQPFLLRHMTRICLIQVSLFHLVPWSQPSLDRHLPISLALSAHIPAPCIFRMRIDVLCLLFSRVVYLWSCPPFPYHWSWRRPISSLPQTPLGFHMSTPFLRLVVVGALYVFLHTGNFMYCHKPFHFPFFTLRRSLCREHAI